MLPYAELIRFLWPSIFVVRLTHNYPMLCTFQNELAFLEIQNFFDLRLTRTKRVNVLQLLLFLEVPNFKHQKEGE